MFFLIVLCLALGQPEKSNPPVPSSRMATEEDQNSSEQEMNERNGIQPPDDSRRDTAFLNQITLDSIPMEKENPGGDPEKQFLKNDDEIPLKDSKR